MLLRLVTSRIAELTQKTKKKMHTLASELRSQNCDKFLELNKTIEESVDGMTMLLENEIEEQKSNILKLIKTFTSTGDDDDDFTEGK